MEWILVSACVALAFANGANDNIKAVATLYGSAQLSYRPALALATVTQLIGSVGSLVIAGALVKAFSGKGLVPPEMFSTSMLAAVALGAALTVGIATRFGLPISTTHAIVGGLVGAGAVAAGPALKLGALGTAFVLPLAVGPILAVGIAWGLTRSGAAAGSSLGVAMGDCVCVDPVVVPAAPGAATGAHQMLGVEVAPSAECRAHGERHLVGVDVAGALRVGHLLSASAVGVARGLNDTPKILGLMVGAAVTPPLAGAVVLGVAMAIGGLVSARRVADTLAHRITPMRDGPSFAANLTTSLLVTGASRLGLPVSTTHVSTGGIFGIGASDGTLDRRTSAEVLSAWLGTLPLAAGLGAVLAWAFAA